jgi:hypothetical protein
MQKNDGTFITGAAGLDSEIDHFADGTDPDGFADCTNEATEIGSSGIYYLALTQAECNYDYSIVQIKSSTSGALTQVVLVNRMNQQADVAAISGDATAADNCEADYDGTGYAGGTIVKGADVTAIGGAALSVTTAQLGVNMVNVAGSAVSSSAAQIGVNLVNIAGAAVSTGTAQIGANVVSQANIDFGATQKSSITAAVPTAAAITSAIYAYVVENSKSFLTMFRLLYAVLCNKSTGGGTSTVNFRDDADGKDRIVATVDNDGNRTAVTKDGTV